MDGRVQNVLEATSLARREMEILERRTKSVLNELHLLVEVSVLNWQTEIETPGFKKTESLFRDYLRDHEHFRNEIRSAVVSHAHEVGKTHRATSSFAENYLIEELVMFLHLYKCGFRVEVYPGSDLDIMKKISDGNFPDFPVQCPERTHIGLKLVG